MLTVEVTIVTVKKETVTVNNLLNLVFDEEEQRLRDYAHQNNVPIIYDDGLAFLEMIIRLHRPTRILEIGCAIGYSAIRMHRVSGAQITTIERNPQMAAIARKNFEALNLKEQIELIEMDALEAFDVVKKNTYDMIFIDAAKAQYMNFFNMYTPLLNEGGIVVCDNMLFHGLVSDEKSYEHQSRSVRGLIRKLSNFHQNLLQNEDYTTSIFEIGDGMSISVCKK